VSDPNVMSQKPLNIGFGQALTENRAADRWIHLVRRLMDAHLTKQPNFLFGN
jgi:hypothetical protein